MCVSCADKIIEFYEFHSMYLESDRKLRDMLAVKNEPTISSLMPFIKDEFEDGVLTTDGGLDEFKWCCNKCPERYRTRQHLRQHKHTHRKRSEGQQYNGGDIKLELNDHWMEELSDAKTEDDRKVMETYQPEVILSVADEDLSKSNRRGQAAKVWRCSKCFMDFETRSQLREHRRMHRQIGALQELRVEKVKNEPKTITDTVWEASTKIEVLFEEPGEIIDNSMSTKWKCRECSKCFKSRDYLRKHRQYERKLRVIKKEDLTKRPVVTDQEKWVCHVCLSPFLTRTQLREHKRTHRLPKQHCNARHANTEPRKYICDLCGKSCSSKRHIHHHLEAHNKLKTKSKVLCNVSEIWLSSTHRFKIDHQVEHERNERKYQCHQCDLTFSSAHHLKTHEKRHKGASAVQPYTSSLCPKTFFESSNARKLMRSVPINDKKYVCNICSASFNRNGNLTVHMYTHNHLYPHQCDRCGAGFIRKYKLKQHYEKCPHIRSKNGEP